jgi:chromosome segregation ATPase
MTGEEIERSIKALFDQQAVLTTDISRLEASVEEMRAGISELKETVSVTGNSVTVLTQEMQTLSGTVAAMAVQAEADRQMTNNSIREFRRQAEADRAEMRNIVSGLANIIGSTVRRVSDLEGRVDRIEGK